MASIPPIDYSGLSTLSLGLGTYMPRTVTAVARELPIQTKSTSVTASSKDLSSRKRKWEGGDGYGMTDEEDAVTREIDPQLLTEEEEDFTEALQERIERLCQQLLSDDDDFQDAEDEMDEGTFEDAEDETADAECDGQCEEYEDSECDDSDDHGMVGQSRNRDSGYMESDDEGFEYCLEDIEDALPLQQDGLSEDRDFTDALQHVDKCQDEDQEDWSEDSDEDTDTEGVPYPKSSMVSKPDVAEEKEYTDALRDDQDDVDWDADVNDTEAKPCPSTNNEARVVTTPADDSDSDGFWPENIFDDFDDEKPVTEKVQKTTVVESLPKVSGKQTENVIPVSKTQPATQAKVEVTQAKSQKTTAPTGKSWRKTKQDASEDDSEVEELREKPCQKTDDLDISDVSEDEHADFTVGDSDEDDVKVFAKGTVQVAEEEDEETDTADEEADDPPIHSEYTITYVSIMIAILAVLVYAIFVNICMLASNDFQEPPDDVTMTDSLPGEPETSEPNVSFG